MAGSITVTSSDIGGGYTKYSIAWVSDASGNVTANTLAVKRGRLHQVKFIPDAAGTQPSDLYDVTLLDADSVDLLLGLGADRSNAASSIVPRLDGQGGTSGPLCWYEGGTLTPTVANAGNAKGGTLVLYVGA